VTGGELERQRYHTAAIAAATAATAADWPVTRVHYTSIQQDLSQKAHGCWIYCRFIPLFAFSSSSSLASQ